MKNTKSLMFLIIGLGVLLLGSVGYIIYDNLSTGESSKIDNYIINDIKDFPMSNDTYVEEHSVSSNLTTDEFKTNFNNIVKIVDNLEFNYSCSFYNEEEKNCEEISSKVIIHSNGPDVSIDLGTTNFEYNSIDVYEIGNYLMVLKGIGSGVDNIHILLYDLSGNVKYENKNSIGYYSPTEDFNPTYMVVPTVKNEILYFVTVDKAAQGILNFNYVDLNKENLKTVLIQSFKAKFYYEG